ncbi:MAG: DinB family protein [Acidobacteriota bacterium]
MSLGQLALHIAETPSQIAALLSSLQVEAVPFTQAEAASTAELGPSLDRSVDAATKALSHWGDAGLLAEWTFSRGGRTLMKLPRLAMVRSIMLNHWYHHRGQLLVYLRLLDVAVPFVYGPSADESPFA